MMDVIINVIINIILLPVAFLVGRFTEGKHLKRLDHREQQLKHIRCCNLKRVTDPAGVSDARMLIGQVAIATDYWKSFVTKLRKIVGGEMKSAQSLMIRGRREALIRLLEEADRVGATEVWNVRYGFSSISMMRGNNGAMQVEIYAYGTAIQRRGN